MVHVPYRGAAPALTDLDRRAGAGAVQPPWPPSIEYIKADKLRVLAVTTAMRSAALPDVPTVADFVPGYESSNWWGIGAPRNTPAAIVETLNAEINAAARRSENQGAAGRPWRHGRSSARLPISAGSSRRKPRNGAR